MKDLWQILSRGLPTRYVGFKKKCSCHLRWLKLLPNADNKFSKSQFIENMVLARVKKLHELSLNISEGIGTAMFSCPLLTDRTFTRVESLTLFQYVVLHCMNFQKNTFPKKLFFRKLAVWAVWHQNFSSFFFNEVSHENSRNGVRHFLLTVWTIFFARKFTAKCKWLAT